MGINAKTLEEQKKKGRVGSEGNYIEPLDGKPITDESEAVAQFASDFGDTLEGYDINPSIFEEIQEEKNAMPAQTQITEEEKEIIPPRGKFPSPVDPDEIEDEGSVPVKKPASQQKVDLSTYVPKSDYESLEKQYNDLQGKFNELKAVENKNLQNLSEQDLKIIARIRHDIENTPLGSLVQDYYDGKLNPSVFVKNKSVKDYMPEGQEYDPTDAMTPDTPSWRAREAWENDRVSAAKKYEAAGKQVIKNIENSKPSDEDLARQEELYVKQLTDKWPTAGKLIEPFKKWLSHQKNLYIPLYFAFEQIAKNQAAVKSKKKLEPTPIGVSRGGSGITKHDQEIYNEFGD